MAVTGHVKVLLLGHSFIRRLHEHCQCINFESLGLNPEEFSLYWKGLGGLKAKDLFQFTDMITDIQPAILYLEIGTNDLCDPNVLPDDIALLVLNFVTTSLEYFPFLKHVILGQVIKRDMNAPRQRLTRTDFPDCVKLFNALMKGLFKDIPEATYWRHKGLCDQVNPFLLNDGVHLNYKGMKKIGHSIKRALVTTKSQL